MAVGPQRTRSELDRVVQAQERRLEAVAEQRQTDFNVQDPGKVHKRFRGLFFDMLVVEVLARWLSRG